MSSFKRRFPARTGGARAFATASAADSSLSQAASSTPSSSPSSSAPSSSSPTSTSASLGNTVSTGIGSLDDILALPPGSVLLLLAPDAHTAWSRLVARHVAAQGVLEGARVVIAAAEPAAWAAGMVWTADAGDKGELVDSEEKGYIGKNGEQGQEHGETEADANERANADKRIAWRYDSLTFETTVGTTTLDASKKIPPAAHARARADGRLVEISFDGGDGDGGFGCLAAIARALDVPVAHAGVARVAIEIAPEHDFSATELTRFLLGLRAVLRPRAAVAVVTLPARFSASPPPGTPGGVPGWIPALAHCADATLTLAGFGTQAQLAAAYAPAHGLLTPHSLPARGHVLAPALRYSTLLGVAGGSEQNLGFRLKRRRWVVETVHLGIEGGSGERRTEPVARAVAPAVVGPAAVGSGSWSGPSEGIEPGRVELPPVAPPPAQDPAAPARKEKKARARVRFGAEDEVHVSHDGPAARAAPTLTEPHTHGPGCGHARAAPRVAIRHDRPDLYEF